MTLTLPLPPSSNRYWRNFRGRMVVSAEAKAYKEQVGWLARVAGVELLVGDVAVTMRIYRAAKRGDTDNFLKVGLDSLNGIAYTDDSQIVRIVAERYDDKHNPRVEVEVAPAR
jgi:crossover junction endodeoxyribonuclease RusA